MPRIRDVPLARIPQPAVAGNCTDGDGLRLFRSWISDPLRVSSVAPSGRRLAELMTREIAPGCGPVIELGPGTGVFTRALIARGIAERDLTLVEFGAEFIPALQARFPAARILQMDAARLDEIAPAFATPPAHVVSGLPLLSMPQSQRRRILAAAFALLRPEGRLYQFTYGPRPPVAPATLAALGLVAERVGGTLRNLPPASVYRFRRAG
ncbi:class I SAM-dependent methyltransferase [Mangrovicoccus algicola]|uniref:Methyltransferase domain-containing protein n=1 Tax=Mangrovicoccus algicola TaxID=2771008 RepID=A0A8J6YPV1_9RHOB|nr:methyltransferase domain-containing protein [Mangrovicoccus algicola]MBE3637278.1 methyltransferase domain-containing protein [Mangrovicoccus algicola]